ncbi:MAG: hypothetical protein ACLP1W_13930 [Rhodomicrobium sp.]
MPRLDEATGVAGRDEQTGRPRSDILVADIVKRIKCEIADALARPIEDPNKKWMRNWTVKVDLLLQANNQGGVTPSVTYTSFFHNAYNAAAGTS